MGHEFAGWQSHVFAGHAGLRYMAFRPTPRQCTSHHEFPPNHQLHNRDHANSTTGAAGMNMFRDLLQNDFLHGCIVEPPNNGHIGDNSFVHCSEVVASSEVEMYGQ